MSGNFLIHQAFRHQLQHARLPRREAVHRRLGGGQRFCLGKQRADLGDLLGHLPHIRISETRRLLQQPLLALGNVAHPRHQLIGIERLWDVIIHPGQITLGSIGRHALGGEKDHRGAAKPFIGTQLLQQAIAIKPRHHHVADHHIRQHLLGLAEAFFPVHRGGHIEAFVFQIGLHRSAQTGLIIHQQ